MNDMRSKLSSRITEGSAGQFLSRMNSLGLDSLPLESLIRKFVVIESIIDPIEVSKNVESYASKYASMGVSHVKKMIEVLPRNSAIGRPLEIDGGGLPMFLLPFFSHLSLPCKPGEIVWVIFDKPGVKDVPFGYWICRVPDFSYVDDVNHTHMPRRWDPSMFSPGSRDLAEGEGSPKFEFRNGAVTVTTDNERVTVPETIVVQGDEDEFEKIIKFSDGKSVAVHEPVPRFNKRPDDVALEGSNNTLIVLGTDRIGPAASFEDDDDGTRTASRPSTDAASEAGVIDIVAGRGQTSATSGMTTKNSLDFVELDKSIPNVQIGEGDVDFKNDRSRVYVSVGTGKTIDAQLNDAFPGLVATVVGPESARESSNGTLGAAVVKSDVVRIVGRSEIVIVSTGYDVSPTSIVDKVNSEEFACIVLKPNGDIVFKPSKTGFIRLGGEDADRAIVCTAEPADSTTEGSVKHRPMISTMGGQTGTGVGSQGTYSSKVLVKAS